MKKISFKSNKKNIFKFILNIILKTHKPDKSFKKYVYNKTVIFFYLIKMGILGTPLNLKLEQLDQFHQTHLATQMCFFSLILRQEF